MEKYKKIPVWNRFSLNLSDISFIITFSHPCGTLIILLFYIMRPSILIFPGFPGKVLCFEIPMAVLTPWEAMILLEKWTQTNSSQQAANCYSQIESSGKGLSRLWSNLMGKLYNYLLLELRRVETHQDMDSAVYFHKNHCSSNLPCLEYHFHFETEFEVHQHTLK